MHIVPQTVWKTNGYKLIWSSQESYLFINSSLLSTVMGWVWLFRCCEVEAVTISVHEWTWFTPLHLSLGHPGLTQLLRFWMLSWQESKPQPPDFLFPGFCSELSRAFSEFSWVLLISVLLKWVLRVLSHVFGDGDSDEEMKELKPWAVHSPSLLLEAALNQGRHNMWEACLKNLQKEPVYTNLSLLNSFSSSLYSLIL